MIFFEKCMSLYSHILRVVDRFTHQLLPPLCIFCGYRTKRSLSICGACQQDLPILPKHCQKCALFLPASSFSEQPLVCGICLKNPPPFEVTYALFPYQPPIIQLIVRLKFRHQLQYARVLGELLTLAIRNTWYKDKPLPDLIIPIPLHPQRLRERGFNQALEMSRPVAHALNIPVDLYGMKRIKPTMAQSGLAALARKQNMANAFIAERDYSGLAIAVIDDVITTGHTMLEFCHTLRRHGANRIDVWCCARRG